MAEQRPMMQEGVPIGETAAPAFARLPDPKKLFTARAERLRWLARTHDLKPYLAFLAGIADVQHGVITDLPLPALPAAEFLGRARENAMPPIDRERMVSAATLRPALDRFLEIAVALDMPDAAADALDHVLLAGDLEREAMIQYVLATTPADEMLAEHSFVAAALQVHFAALAAQLDPASLVPVGDGACPTCGYPPAASMVVGWLGSHGARYCGCALCGTLWNYVRVKCTICGSTKGISYQEIEGSKAIVQAETCGSCHRYVKLLHHEKDPDADIVADDVASLGLDLLMRETAFKRGGVNPFLLGY
ncbi:MULTISPECIES: formate dehydrogenase accessory protein FdhE [Rhodomicrobium]|uniref:formate dehydrogenase accessory protein FdhE n=1 Tax=Rhodomicrobium TaxID=1068 RepID=UPI000B4BC260|nr:MULTISPECIES: formate dehydrogenase accessory protein FdhE [Rhodomicrobium]